MNVIILNTIGEVVAKRAPSGGGGSEGGESNVEYIDLRGKDAINSMPYSLLLVFASVAYVTLEMNGFVLRDYYTAASVGAQTSYLTAIHAVRVDWSAKAVYVSQDVKTAKEAFLEFASEEDFASLTRLTEEEFYNLTV